MEKHLNEKEAHALLGDDWTTLTSKAPQSNHTLDEQALRRGALLLPAQQAASLTVREDTIIDGDLVLSGVLELTGGASLFVRGDLRAQDIAASGSLYVIGALTVRGFFFGAEDTFEAILCQEPQIDTLLLHLNYQYLERGKRLGSHSAKRRVSSEKDGPAALRDLLKALGHTGPLNASAVAQFLRMRSKWGASAQSLAPKALAPAKPATKTPPKKASPKKVTSKKPTKPTPKPKTKKR